MIDSIRYWLALLFLVFWPAAFTFWFVIHPYIAFWRKAGTLAAYSAGLSATVVVAVLIASQRDVLMSIEYGTRIALLWVGALMILTAQVLDLWVRRYLRFPILVGIPQLRHDTDRSSLITDGPFKYVRHPRYSVLMLGLFGVALFSNYLAIYVLAGLMVPLIHALAGLEERDLISRYGRAYAEYAGKTPRFIPRFG